MDDQLRANNTPMIMKLYEAALSMPIRMRLNPTFAQIAYDTITHSEDIFATKGATVDSCIDFHAKVRHIINLQAHSQRTLVTEFKNANIFYHGKPIRASMVRCLLVVEPYAANVKIRNALIALEPWTKKMNEPTMIKRLCEACNKQYGKASQAAILACTKLLSNLRIALTYKNTLKESNLTGEVLFGAGFKNGRIRPETFQTK